MANEGEFPWSCPWILGDRTHIWKEDWKIRRRVITSSTQFKSHKEAM